MTTDTPPRSVHVTIETTSTRKRAEESSRKFVVLSFPVFGNADLINLIETNVRGNPLEVSFGESAQARLLQDDDTEEVDASVDGKPAKVRRSKATNATREKLAALAEAGKTKHAFETHSDDEFCSKCGQADGASVHVLPSFLEAYRGHLSAQDTPSFEHPGNAIDSALEDVANFRCQPMSDEELAFARYVQENGSEPEPEPLSETAQSLIDESRRTSATEAEAEQQREAEEALAGRSR